jgi:peptide/nickel transport system substrate-binding protein
MSLSLLAGCATPTGPAAPPAAEEQTPAETEPAAEPEPVEAEPGEADVYVSEEVIRDLPRNQTFYLGGLQWSRVNGWNGFKNTEMNNALASVAASGGSRVTMYESLYMYNMLDGSMVPLLADGDYEWNEDQTEMTVHIKEAAKWSDGTPVTAHDVAYTWEMSLKHENDWGIGYSPYIASIEAVDDHTVLIKNVLVDGKSANPLQTISYLGATYVLQKAWLEKVDARSADSTAFKNDPADDAVYSGPYGPYFQDDTKVVMIRNDNYWGQDESMWGKLPAPKYLAHGIYADNDAIAVAFQAGEIDANQQFLANVQNLWLEQGLPISTYLPEAPYHICVNMPTAYFNLDIPGLDDPVVRKAIAIATDYDMINANAVTGQSPTFAEVPRSLMNPTAGEQAMYNQEAVAHLQWVGKDIDGANAMLDEAGWLPNADGIREKDGVVLSFNACAPQGWSDWEASMEIVAAAGAQIGIQIETFFPDWGVYQPLVQQAHQDEYDIFMMWTDSATPAMPWQRARQLLSSEFNGIEGNGSGNWGHYSNPRADELLALIPTETDQELVKEYYTELVEIYLTDVPSFSLMYRPDQFHIVNESVWTGFTEAGDGNNIPPMHSTDGYGIADLYNIYLVEE